VVHSYARFEGLLPLLVGSGPRSVEVPPLELPAVELRE
jgi:hypothetical protein